ncbi:hypothetical protein FIBSPDRAFT_891171 [Athelia psychrophila]|uniref:Uncharacterized protein n=1 Tax=Athelia psychrophila TaxID=1759441 RepID=A0A166K2X2_9AGAM|nr:hypothetical protein FIBSPDRAFT_891171 [Fibularhizoctonia sp. CBS 109695]
MAPTSTPITIHAQAVFYQLSQAPSTSSIASSSSAATANSTTGNVGGTSGNLSPYAEEADAEGEDPAKVLAGQARAIQILATALAPPAHAPPELEGKLTDRAKLDDSDEECGALVDLVRLFGSLGIALPAMPLLHLLASSLLAPRAETLAQENESCDDEGAEWSFVEDGEADVRFEYRAPAPHGLSKFSHINGLGMGRSKLGKGEKENMPTANPVRIGVCLKGEDSLLRQVALALKPADDASARFVSPSRLWSLYQSPCVG